MDSHSPVCTEDIPRKDVRAVTFQDDFENPDLTYNLEKFIVLDKSTHAIVAYEYKAIADNTTYGKCVFLALNDSPESESKADVNAVKAFYEYLAHITRRAKTIR